MFDFQFLDTDPATFEEPRVIYIYRTAFLKRRVISRIAEIALFYRVFSRTATLETFAYELTESSLFEERSMSFCDISEWEGPEEVRQLQVSLNLIAQGGTNPYCLLVHEAIPVQKLHNWNEAVSRSVLLEEPVVSEPNIESIFESFIVRNGFETLCAEQRAVAFSRLSKALHRKPCGVDEFSKMLDWAVLVPEEESRSERRRGDVLNEVLINFLRNPIPPLMYRLLKVLDRMKSDQLTTNVAIVRDLYSETEKILRGSDRRYRHNKLGGAPPDDFFVWGLRLMLSQRAILLDVGLNALERLCRDFMNMSDHLEWLNDPKPAGDVFHLYFELDSEDRVAVRGRSLLSAICAGMEKMAVQPAWLADAVDKLQRHEKRSLASRQGAR